MILFPCCALLLFLQLVQWAFIAYLMRGSGPYNWRGTAFPTPLETDVNSTNRSILGPATVWSWLASSSLLGHALALDMDLATHCSVRDSNTCRGSRGGEGSPPMPRGLQSLLLPSVSALCFLPIPSQEQTNFPLWPEIQ